MQPDKRLELAHEYALCFAEWRERGGFRPWSVRSRFDGMSDEEVGLALDAAHFALVEDRSTTDQTPDAVRAAIAETLHDDEMLGCACGQECDRRPGSDFMAAANRVYNRLAQLGALRPVTTFTFEELVHINVAVSNGRAHCGVPECEACRTAEGIRAKIGQSFKDAAARAGDEST